MKSEAQKRAEKRYLDKCDTIIIRVPKKDGARIREAAATKGMSLKQYIVEALADG